VPVLPWGLAGGVLEVAAEEGRVGEMQLLADLLDSEVGVG